MYILYTCIQWVWCGPLQVPVANEGFSESPTTHVTILVVTVTGRGPNPIYTASWLG